MALSTASQTTKPSASTATHISSSSSPSSSPSLMAGARQKGAANGVSNRSRPQTDAKPPVAPMRDSNTPDKHANDRLLFLLASFVGYTAQIIVKSGDQFTGVFSTASLPKDSSEPHQVVLAMTKRVSVQSRQPNGNAESSADPYIGHGENHCLVFDIKDIVQISVPNVSTEKVQVKLTNGASNSFKTDTDISGNISTRERELQRWEPAADSNPDMSLGGSGSTNWDQFETNERLYGVRTDYDENFYTTTIDRSAPSYRQRAAAAEKLAREIEGTATTNSHMAEERGQAVEGSNGMDEEERFSGVKRDFPPLTSNQPNKYTPPARRAPTSHSTTPGAPVDPAIISAQLVRPTSSTQKATNILFPATMIPEPTQKENVEPTSGKIMEGEGTNIGSENTKPRNENDKPALGYKRTSSEEVEVDASSTTASTKSSSRTSAIPPAGLPNTTANVEREVLRDFKSFAVREKLVVQERQRLSARKDREVKLNDLKKFASNFKLKTAVPADMLGILAKDKQKQVEIVEKSQRQLEEQSAAVKTEATPPQLEQEPLEAVVSPRAELPPTSPSGAIEKQGGKGTRGGQQFQNSYNGRNDRGAQAPTGPLLSPKPSAPGNLGQRLLAQTQYRDRGAMQSFSGASSSGNNFGANPRAGSIPSSAMAMPSRFNVQASEFRPNPSAVSFSPTGERSSGVPSPVRTRRQSSLKPVNRTTFFPNGRPRASEKKSIKDGFNPVVRMRNEIQEQNRAKDFVTNGGIPQAYRTPPTWDTSEEYAEKSYVDMFDKAPVVAPSISPANGPLPHQHQLPLHLQQGAHGISAVNSPHLPHQSFPQHGHGQGPNHRFDDHRMQYSTSQQGSFPSPRVSVMMPYGGQMMTQVPSQLGQAVAQFPYAGGQPVSQMRQFPGSTQFITAPGGPLPAQMVLNQAGVNPFMGVPVHAQSPMFSPGQPHILQPHLMSPHAPGAPNFSPRNAPMMMHQGSQQGHAPPPHFYMNPAQHPGQFYGPQHQSPGPHMRGGGVPMTHQQSFNSHVPQHFPGQQRQYSQLGNSFGQQSMPMEHGISQQQHQAAAQVNVNGDRDTSK